MESSTVESNADHCHCCDNYSPAYFVRHLLTRRFCPPKVLAWAVLNRMFSKFNRTSSMRRPWLAHFLDRPICKIWSVILTTRLSKLCRFWKGSLIWVCVCLCFVMVVCYTWIEMQSTTRLSEDRHSHRLLAKISLACRDRSHTPPISSFSVVCIFVLAVCLQCTLCMHML